MDCLKILKENLTTYGTMPIIVPKIYSNKTINQTLQGGRIQMSEIEIC